MPRTATPVGLHSLASGVGGSSSESSWPWMVTRVSQLDPQRMETARSSQISLVTGNRFGASSTLRETDEIALAARLQIC
jgi:hypothetical protein